MPKTNKRRESFDEDDVSTKKAKISGNGLQRDSDGNEFWELASKRRVVISEFKGQKMISIREYYEKDGQTLPGKKGISLPVNQFSTLISLLPEIENALHENGEQLPRPDYDTALAAKEDSEATDGGPSSDKVTKRNFDETSDED